MNKALFGTVSALALILAAGGQANAQATLTTNIDSNSAGTATAPVAIDTENALETFAFQNFAGALQVQQNGSLNSAVSQNMSVDALKANSGGPYFFFSQATSTNTVEGNSAPNASIDSPTPAGDNLIQNDAFGGAAGAVQVQQNRSINSSTGQNMDINPVQAPRVSGGTSTVGLTSDVGDTSGNAMLAGQVDGNNSIFGGAFLSAAGAFQVQQNNSINSSTQQSAGITAMTATTGGLFAITAASEADLTQNVSNNLLLNGDVAGLNQIDGNAFQNAKGAFQVQQSSSVNSSVGQNLAITAVDGVLGSSTQVTNKANATSAVANDAVGWLINPPNTFNLTIGVANIDGDNLLSGNAFSGTSGAFQVQQNSSANSAVGQNMAIAAIKLSAAAPANPEAGTATSTNSVENSVTFESSVHFTSIDNDISGNAFQTAAGAFQVQQNRSLNSTTGQNMQIAALTDPTATINTQVNSTAKLTSDVGDKKADQLFGAPGFTEVIDGNNVIFNSAFESATGAFQVQQNNSNNSSTQQNMSVVAITATGGSVTSLGMGAEADLAGVADLSQAGFGAIGGTNDISENAFANAKGAFQVQQSSSADSAVGQNMAIAAVDASGGKAGGGFTTTSTGNLNSTVSGVTSGINFFTPVGTCPGCFWFWGGQTTDPDNVNTVNLLEGSAFQNAQGAFEVQQNGSINGVTSQNMAITAANLNAASTGSVLANANDQSFVGFNRADSSNINTAGTDNAIESFAFGTAHGAFQVQQNRSINSATGQNMAIAASNDPGAASFGPNNSTATTSQDVFQNTTTNSHVDGNNAIGGNAFNSAAGAFQVQQNNSVNSSTQQNMAIGAVQTNGGPEFGSSDEIANLASVVSFNTVSNVTVGGLNSINGNSLQNARGAFQVQQSNSANSAVSQNMAIVAISVKK